LNVKAQPYFVWSCRRPLPDTGGNEQSICIAKLTTPTQIDQGNIGVISQPMAAWERDKRPLNEGPTPLYWHGQTL
jgi:GH43 family beta-xylosidase